jgi:hypothetical protein
MPVPSAITDLSQTAASNYPTGSEAQTTADNYFRAHASFIAGLRDGKGFGAEVDIASAATTTIGGSDSLFVRITGTTTITSFGTTYNGPRFIRFAGALTLTYNASTLVIPGAVNITTAAGDTCIATPISGGWVVSNYQQASAFPAPAKDHSASGYETLASGLTIQWGTVTTDASGVAAVTFPIVFPTTVFQVGVLGNSAGPSANIIPSYNSATLDASGVTLYAATNAGGNASGILLSWMAIGN